MAEGDNKEKNVFGKLLQHNKKHKKKLIWRVVIESPFCIKELMQKVALWKCFSNK